MLQVNFNQIFSNIAEYNNEAAHNEVRSMMERGERLKIFFCIDHNGFESARIESNTTKRFTYQLTQESLNWILGYLTQGITEDNRLDPTPKEKSTEPDGNTFCKKLLMEFVNARLGNFQTVPEFLSRPGRLTTTANFKNGSIMFFIDRDDEIEGFLRDRKMIA